MAEFVTDAGDNGEKLDRILGRRLGVSRRVARIMIGTGAVEVDGQPWRIVAKPMKAGATVRVQDEAVKAESQKPDELTLDIIHRDQSIIVVDKPAGLLSETDRAGSVSLQTVVPKLLRNAGERFTDVWLVHRLDAGTSGVMVLARSVKSARALDAAFREATVRKEYVAIANGRLSEPRDVDAPIGKTERGRHKVDLAQGRAAFTAFAPLRVGTSATLVQARPRTGRTHQIRVHLAYLGHPILGDRAYGGPGYTATTPPLAIPRVMLHARALTIPHPATGKPTRFEADLHADFTRVMAALRIEL
ncbi:MAG: RluA family pseudouridine synthase [Clostridia bacterium]|nr:RluA family pseudouridine synthase [Deltaproteobacteria bacterium]